MAWRAPAVARTADELDDIPSDGNRYEIIDGELFVTAAPSLAHQRMVGALYVRLRPYAAALGLEVLMAPFDVRASPVTQVEPDLLVLPRALASALRTRWAPMPALVLAVEVLSPSTAAVDRGRKRQLYMSEGVDAYWVLDTESGSCEVWRGGASAPATLASNEMLCWQPVQAAASLEIGLRELFDEIL